MQFTGKIAEFEDDVYFDEYDYEIDDAIATDDRISLDWHEDGEPFHAQLRSSDGGFTYEGNYGSPRLESSWRMTATRYNAVNGFILLIVKWYQLDDGFEGDCIFWLEPVG